MNSKGDFNALFSKFTTSVLGWLIKCVHLLNKRYSELNELKNAYEDIFSGFYSRLDKEDQEFISRDCPLCGSSRKTLKFYVCKFPIVKCERCSFVYKEKTFSQYILGRWHAASSERQSRVFVGAYLETKVKRFKNLFEKLFKSIELFPEGKKFLDVGCGIGCSCIAAQALGMETTGVDLDPGRGGFLAHVFENRFLLINDDFLNAQFKESSFDFIVSTHVLEHVFDIKKFMEKVHLILKRGGIFLVSVPNLSSVHNVVLGEKYARQWPLPHENFFDFIHLERLFRMYGLSAIKAWTESQCILGLIREPVKFTVFKKFVERNKASSEQGEKLEGTSLLGKEFFFKSLMRKYIQGDTLFVAAKKL